MSDYDNHGDFSTLLSDFLEKIVKDCNEEQEDKIGEVEEAVNALSKRFNSLDAFLSKKLSFLEDGGNYPENVMEKLGRDLTYLERRIKTLQASLNVISDTTKWSVLEALQHGEANEIFDSVIHREIKNRLTAERLGEEVYHTVMAKVERAESKALQAEQTFDTLMSHLRLLYKWQAGTISEEEKRLLKKYVGYLIPGENLDET